MYLMRVIQSNTHINTYFICYLQKKHLLEPFTVEWACPNGCSLLSELRRSHQHLHTQRVSPEDFYPLLTLIHFCYFSDSLAFFFVHLYTSDLKAPPVT